MPTLIKILIARVSGLWESHLSSGSLLGEELTAIHVTDFGAIGGEILFSASATRQLKRGTAFSGGASKIF